MVDVRIFTDGACSGNPGRGGYATVIVAPGGTFELSGHEPATTNNRMELLAVIVALAAVEVGRRVCVSSDSKYVIDPLTKNWTAGWLKRQWRKADGSPVASADLWKRVLAEGRQYRGVQWSWVRAHNGNLYNERADALATHARDGQVVTLRPIGSTKSWADRSSSHFRTVRF